MDRHLLARNPRKSLCIKLLGSSRFYKIHRNTKIASVTTQSRFRNPSYQKVLVGTFLILGAYAVYEYRKSNLPLDIKSFLPFVLQAKQSVSRTSSIFTLAADFTSVDDNEYSDIWKKGIWSVQVKQPQIQIARFYTPLPPIHIAEDEKDESTIRPLRFLIRREPQGEVSGYLHNLPLSAKIDLRGPHLEYAIPQDVDEVLFIAGGTGIAPGLQAAYTLLERREPIGGSLKMHILWANRKREEVPSGVSDSKNISAIKSSIWRNFFWAPPLPPMDKIRSESFEASLVKEIEVLKARHRGKLTVDYFIDEEGSYITKRFLETCLTNLEDPLFGNTEKSPSNRKLILVSGPDGFVTHLAGPKQWAGGKETQGSLGGILKKINPSHWEIWKL